MVIECDFIIVCGYPFINLLFCWVLCSVSYLSGKGLLLDCDDGVIVIRIIHKC